ncbi:MAG: hypothetical protein OEY99_08495 [Aigarchaeota archaeon]|nr:hypothetical protein [Aigarchaeota archaeon]
MPRQDLTKQLTLFGETRAEEKLVKKKYEALFWLLTRYTLKPADPWTADFLKSRRGRELQFSHLVHKLAAIRDAKTREGIKRALAWTGREPHAHGGPLLSYSPKEKILEQKGLRTSRHQSAGVRWPQLLP